MVQHGGTLMVHERQGENIARQLGEILFSATDLALSYQTLNEMLRLAHSEVCLKLCQTSKDFDCAIALGSLFVLFPMFACIHQDATEQVAACRLVTTTTVIRELSDIVLGNCGKSSDVVSCRLYMYCCLVAVHCHSRCFAVAVSFLFPSWAVSKHLPPSCVETHDVWHLCLQTPWEPFECRCWHQTHETGAPASSQTRNAAGVLMCSSPSKPHVPFLLFTSHELCTCMHQIIFTRWNDSCLTRTKQVTQQRRHSKQHSGILLLFVLMPNFSAENAPHSPTYCQFLIHHILSFPPPTSTDKQRRDAAQVKNSRSHSMPDLLYKITQDLTFDLLQPNCCQQHHSRCRRARPNPQKSAL